MTRKTFANYHHGALRDALLESAERLIGTNGIQGLSMRRLADDVGVSRSAPYHHFSDKQALLSALAQRGFEHQEKAIGSALESADSPREELRRLLQTYLHFALTQPQTYELMYGAALWKSGQPSEALREVAHASFRSYRDRVATWQAQGLLPPEPSALRLAQISWSSLHGLTRLILDGIYAEQQQLDELLTTLEQLLVSGFERPSG